MFLTSSPRKAAFVHGSPSRISTVRARHTPPAVAAATTRCILNGVFVGAIAISILVVTLLFFLILAFEEVMSSVLERSVRSSFAFYVTTLETVLDASEIFHPRFVIFT